MLRCCKITKTSLILLILLLFIIDLSIQTSFVTSSTQTVIENSISDTTQEDANVTVVSPRMLESDDPITFPEDLVINITSTSNYFDGYNLFVVDRRNRTSNAVIDMSLLITDMNGNVIAKRKTVLMAFAPEFINATTIMYCERPTYRVTFWNFWDNITQNFDINGGHHEIEYNPVDNTIFNLEYDFKMIDGKEYRYDIINEYNLSGNIVWSLHTQNIVPPNWWCPIQGNDGASVDITHSNSIFYDPDEDIIYYNARNPNTFFKINHSSSEVIWGLGEHGNFTLYDAYGNVRDSLFFHAHAVEQVEDKTFILFDNDFHNQTDVHNYRSRILEITINELTMTANESWSWIGSSAYYSMYWGDADRLPNGNRFGTFGYTRHPGAIEIGARLVEVNSVGEIVWEMNFPSSSEYRHGIYRAERIRFNPYLDSPDDIITGNDSAVTISWNTWYNYRPKMTVEGNFKLYLDGIEIDNGSVFYDKLWRPTNLTFDLGILDLGSYNCTLVVFDEIGNYTIDSVNIEVLIFHVEREGPLLLEIGQQNHLLTWFGATTNPFMCNISVDETVIQSFEWQGLNITLDLESIGIGTHLIEFILFNSSSLVLSDSFWITVFPTESPIITPLQTSPLSIEWNDTLVLSWDLFDNSPSRWEIYLNNTLYSTGNWESRSIQLDWTVPILNESCYNVTVVAIDILGQNTLSSISLFVMEPSPPIIAVLPFNTEVPWGVKGTSFSWSVHGGNTWKIWKNGSIIHEGSLFGNMVEISIQNWQEEDWSPGLYNLTLQVLDDSTSTSRAVFISIYIDMGDPYANTVLSDRSEWYLFGENALGAPDGNFALIFPDYGSGFLTLDMGLHEEIIDGEGEDLSIIAQGGNYSLLVSENINVQFTRLGYGSGNMSFDLSGSDLDFVRFIRIEYRFGNNVELDAIVALNVNKPDVDTEIPSITEIADFWVWDNQTSITLSWTASDATPWSYKILVNDTQVVSGSWNGSEITYPLELESSGWWNVTLILYDVFGNRAHDTVLIEARSVTIIPTSTTTTSNPTNADTLLLWISIFTIGTFGVIAVILIAVRYQNRRFIKLKVAPLMNFS